jgi:hypothetical protein
MAVKGVGASLKITSGNTSPMTLTDVSAYLNKISGASNADQLDATVFQPNVAAPIKTKIPGTTERSFSLGGPWTASAETFFAAIEGEQNLEYEYGPEGTTSGKKKIYGHCNCISYSGPQSDVSGITSFTCEIAVTSRNVGSY